MTSNENFFVIILLRFNVLLSSGKHFCCRIDNGCNGSWGVVKGVQTEWHYKYCSYSSVLLQKSIVYSQNSITMTSSRHFVSIKIRYTQQGTIQYAVHNKSAWTRSNGIWPLPSRPEKWPAECDVLSLLVVGVEDHWHAVGTWVFPASCSSCFGGSASAENWWGCWHHYEPRTVCSPSYVHQILVYGFLYSYFSAVFQSSSRWMS